ncbi:MAG: bifunctional phosphoglucose/phosphomannose isomerase [Candidatus Spechtbacterales bacterium]|nr:bifunctional phosphoglucose/phosphomannose isomerase [Candidatus Spechtbacterales bacterium]
MTDKTQNTKMFEVDRSNMKQILIDFPSQFATGYSAAADAGSSLKNNKFENIIVAGMGGSALPGALLEMLAEYQLDLQIPVYIHRSYELPRQATDKSLVIIISYSGNTEEALSAYQKAKTENHTICAITSGGKLEEFAQTDEIPLVLVPKNVQPRIALGYQFSALLALLANAGIIKPQKKEMEELESALSPEKLEKTAEKLAEKIDSKTPLIYSSRDYRHLAYILKIQMNENGKRHAFANYFPELNHNEMVGYETKNDMFVLVLRDKDDHPKIQKRMELTADIIKKRGYSVEYIDINGENMYNKVFNTILFGNWLSYYLAIKAEIDPTPVDIVEEFKKEL